LPDAQAGCRYELPSERVGEDALIELATVRRHRVERLDSARSWLGHRRSGSVEDGRWRVGCNAASRVERWSLDGKTITVL
jgi:hypothetical protein